MTKMTTLAINSKNLYKSYSSEPKDLPETLPEASVNGALQRLYNHDPVMTLTRPILWQGQLSSHIEDLM